MKLRCLFLVGLITASCSEVSRVATSADLTMKNNATDSVEIWLTQWKTIYRKSTCEFKQALSIYGGALYISNDTIYYLSDINGYYDHSLITKTEKSGKLLRGAITKEIEILNDSLYISYDDHYKVYENDSNEYKIVDSYLKTKIRRADLSKVLELGKTDSIINQEIFLGLQISNWVKSTTIGDHPDCR